VSQRLGAKTQGRALTVAWQDIPWKKVQRHVFRLQKRMYQATQRGDVRTVRKLQNLLSKSWYARLLAVRRVTQDNRGRHTAGIDGVKSLQPPQRLRLANELTLDDTATPLRRMWIPKRGTPEKRPLGVPICLAYCISLSNGFGNGHRLDPRRGSRRKLSIGEWTSPQQAPTCPCVPHYGIASWLAVTPQSHYMTLGH